MSQELINLNDDLKRLQNEGYSLEIREGYIFMNDIPYVNSNCEVKSGIFFCPLCLSGNTVIQPNNHVMYFVGEYPCNKDGKPIEGIRHRSEVKNFGHGIQSNHSFSSRPPKGNYDNYYDKFSQYATILSSYAQRIEANVTPKLFRVIDSDTASSFMYVDTNTGRASIGAMSEKLEGHKVGIVGVGGTGSYLLDFLAKTPVSEIHLFDGDKFYQHNAFRAPGAPTKEKLEEQSSKASYLAGIYGNMKKGIMIHEMFIDEDNADCLLDLDCVFLCMDASSDKKTIMDTLVENKIPFIDCGIGINIIDERLSGVIRVTSVTQDKSDHMTKRISTDEAKDDAYSTNIQIAELNALNAAMAIIKWKQQMGFYLSDDCYNISFGTSSGEYAYEDKKV